MSTAQALTIMHRSLDIAQQANDAMCLGCAYRGLGEIYAALDIEPEPASH